MVWKISKSLRRRNNTIHGEFCSLTSKGRSSCYTKKHLLQLLKKWNRVYGKNAPVSIDHRRSSAWLWDRLNEKMSEQCEHEFCWQETLGVQTEQFLPSMPSSWKDNRTEWLSSMDLSSIMKQYESAYPFFRFIGPVPIDFLDKNTTNGTCHSQELCELRLPSPKFPMIGIIFNLDKHNEPGSHWVSMMIHSDKQEMWYYDSQCQAPPPQIYQFASLYPFFTLHVNTIRHQYKTTECGMFCIFFLKSCIEKRSFQEFQTFSINDESMNHSRELFFNPLS
jgi:hypothetical protein